MRLVLVFILAVLWMPFSASSARADGARTCSFVEGLANLPGDLERLRSGGGNQKEFEYRLASTRVRLGDNRRAALFSSAEISAMRTYIDAVNKDFKTHGTDRNSLGFSGRSGISPQTHQAIASIADRFGCDYPPEREAAPLVGFDAGSLNILTVLLSISVLLLTIFAVLKFMRYGQRDKRIICRVPAKLQADGKTHSTQIMNISRGGVMVATPETGIENPQVTLGLPDVAIASKVMWTNSNFAGLAFEKKISLQMVEDISKIKATQNAAVGAQSDETRASPA